MLILATKAARVQPLDALWRPAALELESMLAKRASDVRVGDAVRVEVALVDVCVLGIHAVRVLGGADEAARRRRKALAADESGLASEERIHALRNALHSTKE